MSDSQNANSPSVFWWLGPVVVGVLAMAAALAFGDFRPVVDRFYSVF
jgi:hypothetical protein